MQVEMTGRPVSSMQQGLIMLGLLCYYWNMAQKSTPYRFGANRESLVRERTVPILEKSTMDIIGTVAFTLVIAKPLMGSYTPPLTEQKRSAEGIQLVGHRGTNSIQSALYTAIYRIADTRKDLVKKLPVTVSFS